MWCFAVGASKRLNEGGLLLGVGFFLVQCFPVGVGHAVNLFACGIEAQIHTVLVGGYVIEGHVPAKEIARLLREKPKGVKGLAVGGMPIGSPGMEHGDHREAYKVMTFGPGGQRVYASYAASGGAHAH